MKVGHVAVVLHAHLPFVRHPEHRAMLEEGWLFQAIDRCYVPLARMLERLARESVPHPITLSISPTLGAMLDDALLGRRHRANLEALIALASRRALDARHPAEERLAYAHHASSLAEVRAWLDAHASVRDGLAGAVQRGGGEVITTSATHAVLPLFEDVPRAARAQVRVGLEAHRQRHRSAGSASSRGLWLPECAYAPWLERILLDEGVTHTVLETWALLGARPAPAGAYFTPAFSPGGLAFFARDPRASRAVWSREEGYPGHADYLEHHDDIGYGEDAETLGLPDVGVRAATGIKLRRIGDGMRAPYDPERAAARARLDARDFVADRARTLGQVASSLDTTPISVAPFDAELFGHWWHEGPLFLEEVLRALGEPSAPIGATTLEAHLARVGDDVRRRGEAVEPPLSSWGEGGALRRWCSERNAWVASALLAQSHTLIGAIDGRRQLSSEERALLSLCAQECLQAQASDWAFMIDTDPVAGYARARLSRHLDAFERAYRAFVVGGRGGEDTRWLADIVARDTLFPQLKLSQFSEAGP